MTDTHRITKRSKFSQLIELSDDELVKALEGVALNDPQVQSIFGEFQRRAVVSQQEAAEAQKQAADAAQDTAKWTRWSAIAIACSVVLMLVGVGLDFYQRGKVVVVSPATELITTDGSK